MSAAGILPLALIAVIVAVIVVLIVVRNRAGRGGA
jgi:hypothetical protein